MSDVGRGRDGTPPSAVGGPNGGTARGGCDPCVWVTAVGGAFTAAIGAPPPSSVIARGGPLVVVAAALLADSSDMLLIWDTKSR